MARGPGAGRLGFGLGGNLGGGGGGAKGPRPDPLGFRPGLRGWGAGSSVNPEHKLVHSHPPSHHIRSNAAYNASDSYATIRARGNQDDDFNKS